MLLILWTRKVLSGKAQKHLRSRVEMSNRNSSWTYWPLKMRLLHFLRVLGSIYPSMHHVLRDWNPYHLQNQLTLWSWVIPKNCRHCTSPLQSPSPCRLPPGWTLWCLPQCWYMYTSVYGVTPEDCVISLTTIISSLPQTSVKPAGSYHSLWTLLKLSESSPNHHIQSS